MIPPEDTVLWRIGAAEKAIVKLDDEKAENKDLLVLADEVRSLRRALVIFSLSMVGSGGAFLIGVLALTQNHA